VLDEMILGAEKKAIPPFEINRTHLLLKKKRGSRFRPSEFSIGPSYDRSTDIFDVVENTNITFHLPLSLCCPRIRPFDFGLVLHRDHINNDGHTGGHQQVERVANYHHRYGLPPSPCKCCCYQNVAISTKTQTIGWVQEDFWCCVPQFLVLLEDGSIEYVLHKPTRCFGVCVDRCYSPSYNDLGIPFFIYYPFTKSNGAEVEAGLIMQASTLYRST
jgi:hypothetical protein